MTINVKEVKVKNFLSYGNAMETNKYEFQNGIDIVLASNGSGKSSLTLDALMYAFYGKPYRKIKLSLLQNTYNTKELEVNVTFSKGNDNYEIQRGMNPQKFLIFKNSSLIDELANVKDYQKMLETDILETSEKTFRNLIVLGGVGITSGFMDMSQSDKEELITNIIDLKLINLILDKVKEKTQKLKTIKTELEYRKDSLYQILMNEKERLTTIKNAMTTNIEKLTTHEEQRLISLKDKHYKTKEALNILTDKVKEKQYNLNNLKNKQEIYNNSIFSCVYCGKDNHTCEYNINEIENDIKHAQEFLQKYEPKIKELTHNLNDNTKELQELQAKEILYINTTEKTKDITQDLLKEIKTEIKLIKTDYDNVTKELQDVKNELDKYNKITDILGKNNIKKFIINQQIPYLNKEVNIFLQKFFSDYSFYFDDKLKDIVLYKDIEQDYNQLSSGQKVRISFALMFAFIKFLENKNTINWNILVLDEVLDSSLDFDGIQSLLQILKNDFNKNIIIISHNQDIKNLDMFSRKVSITRDRFSKITFDSIGYGSNRY